MALTYVPLMYSVVPVASKARSPCCRLNARVPVMVGMAVTMVLEAILPVDEDKCMARMLSSTSV